MTEALNIKTWLLNPMMLTHLSVVLHTLLRTKSILVQLPLSEECPRWEVNVVVVVDVVRDLNTLRIVEID